MSETVKVISAANPNPWEHGITYYDMVFDRGGQQFECSWGTKGGEPQPGEEVTGEFSQKGDGSWKFTKGSKDKPTGASFSSGSKEFKGGKSGRDLDASIARQVALKVLSEAICSEDSLTPPLRKYVEEIEQFILQAGQAAKQAQGMPPVNEGANPPSSASPGPASPPADDSHQYFCKLLGDAALNTAAAQALASFIVEKFDAEQRTRAKAGLEDSSSQMDTLAKLRLAYEKATGELLPDPSDEDIPF